METIFAIVLSGVLFAAVVSVVVMGIRQRRRRLRLSQQAHGSGMRFAAEDPFDVPLRYRHFALIDAGHSPRAHNVTYGRLHGLPVRAFDFRYEVGHGTRRLTRHYAVVVVETGRSLPPVLLWNREDLEAAPLAVRHCRRCLGPWVCGDVTEPARKLAAAAASYGEAGGSVQTRNQALLLCGPEGRRQRRYTAGLEAVSDVVRVLIERGQTQAVGNVENRSKA
ncbi:MAG: hypothetical protein ACLFVW_02615 [Phycisphaerae bacterium]